MKSFFTILLLINFYLCFSQADITSMEYFLDSDPGYGLGTPISITSGTIVDANFTIPSALISVGFHVLVVRAQDENSVWGVQENISFYATSIDPVSVIMISAAEYFLDTDPGYGLATPISIASGNNIDENFVISGTDITMGFHQLVIRIQDSSGQWSVQDAKSFYVSEADPLNVSNIVSAEYYLDIDPGVGLATSLAITSGISFEKSFTIPAIVVTPGFHNLVIRIQDEGGQWGIQESKSFYVSNANPLSTTNVVSLEYFIDVDPGVGNGTSIDIANAVNFESDEIASTSTLAPGMHSIYFRALDELGVWSVMESRNFLVDKFRSVSSSSSGQLTNIGSLEYFFGDDPGIGQGINMSITNPTASIDLDTLFSTGSLVPGEYTLGVRIANELGFYGVTELVSLSICDGAFPSFSFLGNCSNQVCSYTDLTTNQQVGDVYSWDFDGDNVEDDSSVGNTSYTYTTAGNYSASLIITNGTCITSKTIDIVVNDSPSVSANSTDQIICAGELITLTGSGALNYNWDNSVSDGVAFVPLSTVFYTVIGTDTNNCSNSDQIEVVVNELPIVIANVYNDDVCIGEEIIFSGTGAVNYEWDKEVINGEPFVASISNTFNVIGTDDFGCQNFASIEINVRSAEKPIINIVSDNGNNIVLMSNKDNNIQWYESGEPMEGETNPTIEVSRTYFFGGDYQVEFTENGCSVLSDLVDLEVLGIGDLTKNTLIWPNPVQTTLNLNLEYSHQLSYSIVNLSGKMLIRNSFDLNPSQLHQTVDVSGLEQGIYFLVVKEKGIIVKFIKME